MAAIWLVGLAPAVVLPGGLNRFVFIKLFAVAMAWACALLAPRQARLQRAAVVLLTAAAAALTLAALLGSAPLPQLLGRAPRYEGLVSISVYVGALLIGAWLLGPGGNVVLRVHLLRATALSASLLLAVAVAQTLGQNPLATSVSRPGSLLGNATEQGAYGAGAAGLAMVFAVSTARTKTAMVALGSGLGLVALSASRGAVIGLVVATLVALALGPRQNRRTTAALLGAAVVATLLVPLSRDRLLLRSPLSHQTVTGRAQEWAESINLLAQHPILGVGPSGFVDASPSVQSADYIRLAGTARLDSPHSLLLQLGFSGGMVLLVVAGAALWLLVRNGMALRAASPQSAVSPAPMTSSVWAVGVLAAVAGWSTVMLTHFSAPGSAPFFCLLAGSLFSRARTAPARRLASRTGAVAVGAFAVLLAGAAVAEIPLRSGLAALSAGDGRSAVDSFGLAHALRPWDADLDAQMAHALVAQPVPAGLSDAVEGYLARASEDLPADHLVMADLALRRAQQGRWPEARALLDRAHELAPNDPVVLLLRGQVRGRTQDLSGAIADVKASASLSPGNRLSLEVLASLYAQAGQPDLASETLARAQSLGL